MSKKESICIGNKFIGLVNNKIFTIIGFKEDAGNKYVVLECEGKKTHVNFRHFKHLLLKEA